MAATDLQHRSRWHRSVAAGTAEAVDLARLGLEPVELRDADSTEPDHVTRRWRRDRARTVLSGVAAVVLVGTATVTLRAVAAERGSTFPGVLQVAQYVSLDFGRAGTVAAVFVKPGESVQTGQLLATLQPGSLAQQIVSDRVVLASDEQRLAQLLGPAGAAAARAAALAYDAAEQRAASTVARGATGEAEAQAALDAAKQSVAGLNGRIAALQSAVAGRCPASTVLDALCNGLESQLSHDRQALAAAGDRVTAAQTRLSSASTLDNQLAAVASSEVKIAQTQRTAFLPSMAISISAARDAIANDQARLAADLVSLSGTQIVAPGAGVVLGVGGVPGETVTGAGAIRPTAGTGPGNGATASANDVSVGQAPTSVSQPAPASSFIEIEAGSGLDAVAQVPETSVVEIRVGERASLAVDSVRESFPAHVTSIVPLPVLVAGSPYYQVIVSSDGPLPTGLLTGMTVNITF